MSGIIIVWATSCISNELRVVNTIRRARWYITWQEWKIDSVKSKSSRLPLTKANLPFKHSIRSRYINRKGCHIGQTSGTLRQHFGEQTWHIKNNSGESVPIHFNQPKHTLNDVQLIPMLHINNNTGCLKKMHTKLIKRKLKLITLINNM